ncbi:MAG TPA: 2-oxo acid dehydrogenase subunit E2 [Candidatus Krumholzibacteria bacterium]|nr:2-oxo acid dehydrogenase subunit E2 [Candidatus Krumholzibacteria bacterium]HPD70743.1 2-oxo acid dehydrogenase subunit E2 [Candidatus Krumholzibacteria bacterium]HRY39557.1 2-oxo acid dehydrogenase subunit E2 [Candidatus Krumholzibacteria bacterium]
MTQEIRVPEVSDGVTKGKVIGLSVAVGDRVEVDQTLLELETDKAVVALPSPFTGTITAILVGEGDEVAIGQVVMAGQPESAADPAAPPAAAAPAPKPAPAAAPAPKPGPAATPAPAPAAPAAVKQAAAAAPPPPRTESLPPGEVAPASPVVRRIARELGVDIGRVTGSGPGGRISEEDVREFVKRVMTGYGAAAGGVAAVARPLPAFAKWGPIERRPLSQVRRITADAMAYAWATAPRVTQDDRADVTGVEAFREDYNRKATAEDKLTMTAILVAVVARALRLFPQLNSSLDLAAGELVLKQYVHIGVAVDTPAGLLVPVIRDADRKGLATIARELNAMAARTRERRIAPADLEGGSFTISNLGGIGGTHFTPIVYAPQVAILGVSRAEMEPVWDGREFQPRLRLPLSLSYDHRVVDGADGARFVRWLCAALEQPLLLAVEDR